MNDEVKPPVNEETGIVTRSVTRAADVATAKDNCYSSLDKNNPKHLALLIKCLERCDKGADEVLDEILNIQHIMCQNVEKLNQTTGELESAILTKLIMVDGSTVGTCSKGIFMSLQGVINILGAPPWEHGIAFKIKQKRTEKGYKMLHLEFVGINSGPEVLPKKGDK